ncbi:MAG: hypothetical protein WC533_02145 [Candidatus Pacearchaeota archaeon]
MAEIADIIEKQLGEKAVKTHELIYNSSSETLEPIYFWTLDLMNDFFSGKVEKLADNFTSSPGGGHFAEMGQRKAVMQKNVTDNLAMVNTVIKSVINLIYDLKDFEIRLANYDDANSKNEEKRTTGMLALKQIWLDNVDIKRGRGSIHGMAQDLNFVTLRDAFLAADSEKEIDKLDLNTRVIRVIKPRLEEFLKWKELSEKELRKRYQIQVTYLKSQVNTLQLYSRWVKPYLKAAQQLEMRGNERNPELVTPFNTIILELALFGKKDIKVEEEIKSFNLPEGIKKPKRDYYNCLLIEFHFRGIPNKVGQHYVFGGKATMSFKGYALNSDQLALFESELKKSDMNDVLKLIEGATTESLDQLKEDIDHFIKKDEKKEEEKSKEMNPFKALFGNLFPKKDKNKDKDKEKNKINSKDDIKKDSYVEKQIREIAKKNAEEMCFNMYDIYKKAHKMLSHDNPYE